jgi:hypothetical protein
VPSSRSGSQRTMVMVAFLLWDGGILWCDQYKISVPV